MDVLGKAQLGRMAREGTVRWIAMYTAVDRV